MNKPVLLASCVATICAAYVGYLSLNSSADSPSENTDIAAGRMGGGHEERRNEDQHRNREGEYNHDYHRHDGNYGEANFGGGGVAAPVIVPDPYSDDSQNSDNEDPEEYDD